MMMYLVSVFQLESRVLTAYLSLFSLHLSFTATISKDECAILNNILGNKTLSGCDSNQFNIPGGENLTGMPLGARRMTKKNSLHASNGRKQVTVNEDECNNLAAILSEQVGEKEARANLPMACQKMINKEITH
jgi:hypothetical protein